MLSRTEDIFNFHEFFSFDLNLKTHYSQNLGFGIQIFSIMKVSEIFIFILYIHTNKLYPLIYFRPILPVRAHGRHSQPDCPDQSNLGRGRWGARHPGRQLQWELQQPWDPYQLAYKPSQIKRRVSFQFLVESN